MGGVRLSGAAATVTPQAFVSHSIPSWTCAAAEVALSQFHFPTSIVSSKNAARLGRLRSDVLTTRSACTSVATTAGSPKASDSEKTSRKRLKGRAVAVAVQVEAVDSDVSAGDLFRESLYARLEHAYRQPSFDILMRDFEAKLDSLLKDDDSSEAEQSRPEAPVDIGLSASLGNGRVAADPDLNGDVVSSSISSPKVEKNRPGQRPKVERNRIVRITKSPGSSCRPRSTTAKEVSQVVEEPVADCGGKRRLSLRTRIAMRQNKQQKSTTTSSITVDSQNMSPEDQDLWSQEADDLINKYSVSLDLTTPLWDNLDHRLLTAIEENRLAMRMKPMKKLQKLQAVLKKQLGREPTEEEWASGAGVELSILRRRLVLGRAARTKLIQSNLRLVLSQAHKYYKESMSLSVRDLCQEGVVGLMQAIDKFDPAKGYRFSTYGIYWIRNSILRAQTKSGHILRSPHNVSSHRVHIKRARMELGAELGRPPTNDEIRTHLGISADRFRDILRTTMRTSSLHEHDRVTGRQRIDNLVGVEDALSVFASNTSMVQYGLDDVLDSLRPQENLVLRQRFGLDGKGQRSLSEVGLILNLSREMVRRHELRGILKLKHPTRVEYLRNYLNL